MQGYRDRLEIREVLGERIAREIALDPKPSAQTILDFLSVAAPARVFPQYSFRRGSNSHDQQSHSFTPE